MSRVFFGTNVSGGVGGERSFVFVDNDRVNMSIWNGGRVAIGNMTYAQTNANYALFTEKGILTERIKLAAQTSPDWASAPTAILHTVGTVRFQNLPSGTGKALVVDANGNVFVSNTLAGIAPNNGSQPLIEAQAKEINDLKARLERLEAFLSNQMSA